MGLATMNELDPAAATEAEKAAGGVPLLRYLQFLDDHTSTRELGFRIDAARTIVQRELKPLPLPEGTTIGTLRTEEHVCAALATFLQHDLALAKAIVTKIETLETALQRSEFFSKHVLLRSSLLLFYDDSARMERLELKMINFAFSYALPAEQTTTHDIEWNGTPEHHAWLPDRRQVAASHDGKDVCTPRGHAARAKVTRPCRRASTCSGHLLRLSAPDAGPSLSL